MSGGAVDCLGTYDFLTTHSAQKTLGVSHEEAQRVLTTFADNQASVQLLYGALRPMNNEGLKFTCGPKQTMASLTNEAELHLYGIQNAAAPTQCAAHMLCSSNAVTERPYPLKTREQMESTKASAAPAVPTVTKAAAGPTVKVETVAADAKPAPIVKVEKTYSSAPAAPPVKPAALELKQTPVVAEVKAVVQKREVVAVPPAPPAVAVEEDSVTEVSQTGAERKQTVAPPTASLPPQAEKPPVHTPVPAPAPATPAIAEQPKAAAPTKRQVTLFGSAVGGKRSREASPATKASTKVARKRKEKPETKSLTKLAKASANAKEKVGPTAESAKAHSALRASLFDDDAGASKSSASERESACETQDRGGLESAEHSVIDVEVTAANDEVVLFEDAPPLAFCKAEEPKRERAPKTEDPSDLAQQPKISNFFNPDLLVFQKDFVREVDTEMKKVGDEFFCTDVVVYRSVKTGETISEKEYHRRAAQIGAQAKPNTSPSKSSDEGAADSPPAAQASSTNKVKPMKIKQEQKSVAKAPVKTLFSYFKA